MEGAHHGLAGGGFVSGGLVGGQHAQVVQHGFGGVQRLPVARTDAGGRMVWVSITSTRSPGR
jgi:hypothetical protein